MNYINTKQLSVSRSCSHENVFVLKQRSVDIKLDNKPR